MKRTVKITILIFEIVCQIYFHEHVSFSFSFAFSPVISYSFCINIPLIACKDAKLHTHLWMCVCVYKITWIFNMKYIGKMSLTVFISYVCATTTTTKTMTHSIWLRYIGLGTAPYLSIPIKIILFIGRH